MFDLHKNPIARALPYTWATLPAAGTPGRMAWCTNFGVKGALLVDDGVRWKPSGMVTLASLDVAVSGITNTESIALQYLIPASMWALKDHLRLFATMTKSGATDTGIFTVRCGTPGLITDTPIQSSTMMAAANLAVGTYLDFRLDDATHVQEMGASAAANPGYSIAGNGAASASTVITSAALNALFISVGIRSSSTNNTVGLIDAVLKYDPAGN